MEKTERALYVSVLGDSISTLEGYLPPEYPAYYRKENACYTNVYLQAHTWWGRVISRIGGELLVNNSWSGSYVSCPPRCEIESYACSEARTGGLGREGILPDLILVHIGSNDRGACLPLVSEDKTDLSVIDNAYRRMLARLKEKYPQARILCCTFAVTACSRDPWFYFPKTQMGVPMEDYATLIRRAAADYGCMVADLFAEEATCDTVDGLHPNAEGMEMIADCVIRTLRENGIG